MTEYTKTPPTSSGIKQKPTPHRDLADFKKALNKHKQTATQVATLLERTKLFDRTKRIEAMRDCGRHVLSIHDPNTGMNQIIRSIFCGWRHCPICMWRRSRKHAENIRAILDYEKADPRHIIFLTFTIKNVPIDQLADAIQRMQQAWRRMTSNKKLRFMQSFIAGDRALEVTFNDKERTCHPHFHVLVEVCDDYFTNPDKWLSVDKLRQIWWKALNRCKKVITEVEAIEVDGHLQTRKSTHFGELYPQIPEPSIVDMEELRGKNDDDKRFHAAYEVAKYETKPADFVDDVEYFEALVNALKGVRTHELFGKWKEIAKKLKQDDTEAGNADLCDGKADNQTGLVEAVARGELIAFLWTWFDDKQRYEKRQLSADELMAKLGRSRRARGSPPTASPPA